MSDNKLKLLFVDDDYAQYIVDGGAMQSRYGWDVDYAKNSEEAYAALQKSRYDAAVLDRRMPHPRTGEQLESVGDDLLVSMVARWPHICPVMLTNHPDLESAMAATRNGAFRYVVKGVSADLLNVVCRSGVRFQWVRNARHSLLAQPSLEEFVARLEKLVDRILSVKQDELMDREKDPSFTCRLLKVGPNEALLSTGFNRQTPARYLSDGTCVQSDYVPAAYPIVASVLDTCRSKLESNAELQGLYLESVGTRLVVPVRKPLAADDHRSSTVDSLLWLESSCENGFDYNDVELFNTLADYFSCALAKEYQLDECERASHRRERDVLVTLLDHKLRTPLSTARLEAEYLLGSEPAADNNKHRVERVLVCLGRIEQHLDNLGEHDHEPEAYQELVDIREVIDDVLGVVQPKADSAQCRVSLEGDLDQLPLVQTSERYLNYALTCLLVNAIEAVQEKRLAGGPYTNGSDEVVLYVRTDPSTGKSLSISVIDSGYGFGPNVLPHVFDKYFSTKAGPANRENHGIGLWEVRRFADRSGGEIRAMNAIKGGAEFCLILPVEGPANLRGGRI